MNKSDGGVSKLGTYFLGTFLTSLRTNDISQRYHAFCLLGIVVDNLVVELCPTVICPFTLLILDYSNIRIKTLMTSNLRIFEDFTLS